MAIEGGCNRAMKYALIVFNILVFIAGCVAIGLGVWTLVSDYGAEKMKAITGNDVYQGACLAIIIGGCIVASIAFVGAFGAICESRFMLGLYFIIMLLLLILFVVAAVLGFFFRNILEDELEKQMSLTLTTQYQVNQDNTNNKRATDVWDTVQEKLKCCGVSGDIKSDKSWYIWQKSQWFERYNKTMYVPRTCCNVKFQGFKNADCQVPNYNKPDEAPKPYHANLTTDNPTLYEIGCIDKLKNEIEDHIVAIAAIAVVVLIVMVLSIIFSVCVCMEIRRNKAKMV